MLGILEIRNGEIFLMSNDNIFLSHKSLCVTFNIVLLAFYFPPALLSLHYGQIFRIYIYICIYFYRRCACATCKIPTIVFEGPEHKTIITFFFF